MSPSDPQVNQMWNQLNNSFGQFVSARFKDAGKRVIDMPHPVEARDTGANTDRLLKKAQQENCNLIVSTSMYANQQTRQFISSLQVNPIVTTRSDLPAGFNYTVGKETFRKEQANPLSKETLDSLIPSEIAKSLVDVYLSSPQ